MAPVSSKARPGPLDVCEPLKITPKLLTKLKESLSDPSYKEMIESTVNVNTRIAIERKIRLPFLGLSALITVLISRTEVVFANSEVQKKHFGRLDRGSLLRYRFPI